MLDHHAVTTVRIASSFPKRIGWDTSTFHAYLHWDPYIPQGHVVYNLDMPTSVREAS